MFFVKSILADFLRLRWIMWVRFGISDNFWECLVGTLTS